MPTILITGGHSGIGLECAKQLASGFRLDLLLAGRDPTKIEATAENLRASYGVRVLTLEVDMASLASVRQAATTCRALIENGDIDSLQAIVCNAGAQFMGPISYSADGYEETFATNHLGNFLLVNLLLDSVSDRGRVVFTASGTHDPDTMDGKMVGAAAESDARALANQGKNGGQPLSGGKRYATSKLCTILFAYELDRRLRAHQSAISSIAFDPGLIPETGLIKTSPSLVKWLIRKSPMKWVLKQFGVTMGSLNFSGAALARLVADPAFANGSGKYFQSNNGSLNDRQSSKVSYDEARALKLWNDSKVLVDLQPDQEPHRLQ